MMVKPAVTDLLKKVDNRYSLIIMTSKRARQIASGATPLVNVDEKSPVTVAVNEIFDEKVYRVNEDENEETASEENEEVEE